MGYLYFFVENKGKPLCLICQKTVAIMKEYIIKRHYNDHKLTFENIIGDQWRNYGGGIWVSYPPHDPVFLIIKHIYVLMSYFIIIDCCEEGGN